mmetsp:Transcript_49332/g.147342  ORF Transcript_49332/g.147342 Transcript_49332/m.147342 type:complete len:247 (+) Transcript_49332:332-1072(+)
MQSTRLSTAQDSLARSSQSKPFTSNSVACARRQAADDTATNAGGVLHGKTAHAHAVLERSCTLGPPATRNTAGNTASPCPRATHNELIAQLTHVKLGAGTSGARLAISAVSGCSSSLLQGNTAHDQMELTRAATECSAAWRLTAFATAERAGACEQPYVAMAHGICTRERFAIWLIRAAAATKEVWNSSSQVPPSAAPVAMLHATPAALVADISFARDAATLVSLACATSSELERGASAQQTVAVA